MGKGKYTNDEIGTPFSTFKFHRAQNLRALFYVHLEYVSKFY